MFRGSYLTRVDDKFRLKVPAEYKRTIDEKYGPQQFYITSRTGKAAQIYPLTEWRKLEDEMMELDEFDESRIKFFKATSYFGQMVEMDSQGRLLLPQKIRERAKLNEELLVSGQMTFLEVENHDLIDADEIVMTADEMKAIVREVESDPGSGQGKDHVVGPQGRAQKAGNAMNVPQHVPVLLDEALKYLNVRSGGVIVDATLGLGGHSSAIARRLGGSGKLICFDRDPEAMAKAKLRLEELAAELGSEMPEVIYEPRAFSEAAEAIKPGSIDGLLADFGVSSLQLDEAHRGFSFRSDGPLDMRMDTRSGETAGQVVNQEDEKRTPPT